MVISRSSIPQQIMKPGVKKKKKSLYRQAKDQIKKLAKERKERKEQFKITQAEKRKNNIFNKQDKIQLAQKEKENEKSINKYMGASLNTRRK